MVSQSLRILALLVMSSLLFSCASRPGWVETLNYQPDELSEVKIGNYGFPYLSVRIAGQQLELVFDTGNMLNLMLTQSQLQSLDLPKLESAKIYMEGAERTQATYMADTIEAFGRSFSAQTMTESPGDVGLIDPRYLLQQRFTLDYQHRLLGVTSTPLPALAQNGQHAMPLVPAPQDSLAGIVVIEGTLSGEPVLIQLDTGKSRTVIHPALVAAKNIPQTSRGHQIDVGIAGHQLRIDNTTARTGFLTLYGELYALPLIVSLGSDTLKDFVLTVDYQSETVLLDPAIP